MRNSQKIAFAVFFATVSVVSFQQCSAPPGAQLSSSSASPVDSNGGAGDASGRLPADVGGTVTTRPTALAKLGLNLGIFAPQAAVDAVRDIGGWYYNYSPYPDRNNTSVYTSLAWANSSNKEFVPMVMGLRFKLNEATASCPLIEASAQAGESLCTVSQLSSALGGMKAKFTATNRPKFLIGFNEPFIKSPITQEYAITPWQAAYAWPTIETAAGAQNLKLVSPSVPTDGDGLSWLSLFFKRCFDRASDPLKACNVDNIYAINIHLYRCDASYWQSEFRDKAFQTRLISLMNGTNGTPYGGKDWASFVMSRKIWVTETNCNWDSDFLAAAQQGNFIRTSKESCLRATGQKASYGSLHALATLPASAVERFSWWNLYANPNANSDTGTVTASSRNRILAARMLDDNYILTPVGRAIKQLYNDESALNQVDCN